MEGELGLSGGGDGRKDYELSQRSADSGRDGYLGVLGELLQEISKIARCQCPVFLQGLLHASSVVVQHC
ncbi:hypothetical protein IscW_ISCW002758 [Ixodes scapularis]|uniref:Uncharacterized protein n=1 Tax=Ixodes scapularis TaxID=6945 RepID=B7P911_IXOSC|nr:hypothetical protein IscW_ISCW002758 [Ixodes scapularis]|eukprot:XP_002403494.1 hypothetical protein IscW_ISCW002758 [Ixodes scapularis]